MSIYLNIKKRLDHFTIDIEFGFEKGILVIQGESGAGKTTVLNCISGLSRPDEGIILLRNKPVFDSHKKIDIPARLRNIGYLFQNFALFPNMSVRKNILYGIKNKPEYKDPEKRRQLIAYSEQIMETFGISHLKQKHPLNISGGEKQRAALARALVTRPYLLLLDEPFSALDENTKKTVYKEFTRIKETFKIPTILITHDPTESEMFADHCIFMKSGRIA